MTDVTYKADEKPIEKDEDAQAETVIPMGKRAGAPTRAKQTPIDYHMASHLWQEESGAVDTNMIPGPAEAYDAHVDTEEKRKSREAAEYVKQQYAKHHDKDLDYSKLDVSDPRYKQPSIENAEAVAVKDDKKA